jgi:hypothetical protein
VNHITDEVLNKYIDNELNSDELSLLNEHIRICDSCFAKLKAQRVVENNLRKIVTFTTSFSFAEKVMQKISSSSGKFVPRKSYFFRIVFSVFILGSLAVVALVFANLPVTSSGGNNQEWVKLFDNYIVKIFSAFENSLNKINLSLLGTILTFILFVSGYFVFESHRKIKDQIKKL